MGRRPILAVIGPTAAGKSRIAVDTAARANQPVEIVAIDAFSLYRGMNVGTAKPSIDDLAQVPHHLIDALDPSEESSVAWFQAAARDAIRDIAERGATPLLVGGSGLYFRAVVDGLEFPSTDEDVRLQLADEHEGDPLAAHTLLVEVDPEAAAKIDPANLRRTVRALEVIEITGRKFSSFAAAWGTYESVIGEIHVFGLEVADKILRTRIASRSAKMVGAGLVDECRTLREQHSLSRTALQAIGYAEAFAVLDGELDEAELPSTIDHRTWRYARRQRSWFKRDPRVQWIPPAGAATALAQLVAQLVE